MATESERQELHAWVEEYSDFLFRYTRKHFSDQYLAEEIVQETFVAAVKAIGGFKRDCSPKTWLTSILKFKIIDRIRAKERDNSVSLEEVNDNDLNRYFDEVEHWRSDTGPVHWQLEPDTVFEQKQFVTMFDQCMGKLPTRFKNVFLLREQEGLSRKEISEGLKLSSANVGVILHRSRLALRDCLQVNWITKQDGD